MPYIKQRQRERLNSVVASYEEAENAGELNYLFTAIANAYIARWGLRYQNINDVLGALEGAKAEFYRRVAVPYENNKIAENGDVYPPVEASDPA